LWVPVNHLPPGTSGLRPRAQEWGGSALERAEQRRYRQWILTFPFALRFLLPEDHKLITAVLGIAGRLLLAWQRRLGALAIAVEGVEEPKDCDRLLSVVVGRS
jgi:hypothetical protein